MFWCEIDCPTTPACNATPAFGGNSNCIVPIVQYIGHLAGHDIDHQLSTATKVSIAGTGISTAAAIFLAIEVHLFVRAAIAAALGCLGAFAVLSFARLSLPLLAIAVPWVFGIALVLAAVCVALWFGNRRFRKQATAMMGTWTATMSSDPASPPPTVVDPVKV